MLAMDYLNDWGLFIKKVASMFEAGASEVDISKELSGEDVCWEGKITEVKLGEEYAPGVALRMKPAFLQMNQGKTLRADYLFLNTENVSESSWKECRVGDVVKFKATIRKSEGPFPAVQLSVDDEDPEILLMVRLYERELVDRKGTVLSRFMKNK